MSPSVLSAASVASQSPRSTHRVWMPGHWKIRGEDNVYVGVEIAIVELQRDWEAGLSVQVEGGFHKERVCWRTGWDVLFEQLGH